MALPYDSLEELRARLETLAPHLQSYSSIEESAFGKIALKAGSVPSSARIESTPIESTIDVPST